MSVKTLIQLVQEYYLLEDGALIDRHTELLKVVHIQDTIPEHPHIEHTVYITRRSFKHFVESRRAELLRGHTIIESLEKIIFAIKVVPEVILEFENYELEPPNSHFYVRDFSEYGMPMVRVLVEQEQDYLCIKSIHFLKRTKKHR